MVSVLENLKKVFFMLFIVGYKQMLVNEVVKLDGSVFCIILVVSVMGFFFLVLEIFELLNLFEMFFIF